MAELGQNTGPSSQSDEGSEFDLKDILAQLRARIYLIVLAVILGALIGTFYGQLPPNEYQTNSVVQIEQRADRVALPSELIGDFLAAGGQQGSGGLETEIHIIRSRLVLGPVVERLNIDTISVPATFPIIGDILQRRNLPYVGDFVGPEYARVGEYLDAALEDLPESMLQRRFPVRVTGPDAFTVTLPDDTILEGLIGEVLQLPEGGTLVVSEINASAGREYTVYQEPLRNSVGRISSGLTIRERGGSGIVDFAYRTNEARDIVSVLNVIIGEYINQNLRRSSAEIDRSIEFIEQQMIGISEELRAANAELSAYRQNRQLDELSIGTQELLAAAVEVEARLEALAFEKEQLLQVLTINHPDVKSLEIEESRLEARFEEIRRDLATVPEVEQELARLVQRMEGAQALDQQLRERVEQLRILQASAVGNMRVLEPAETTRRIGPDRRRPIAAGAGIGLLLSMALVLGLNFLRNGIEDAREIEALGLPLFATVNKADVLSKKDASSSAYGLALHDPGNLAVESLRGLRTGLKFALASANNNSLMVTSCVPSDGKSFISLNLAIVTGQTGAKVLLIDADMRRGFLRKYFKLDRAHPGLSDILTGSSENCIEHFPDASIDFMPTGRFPPNPSELLEGQAFAKLLETANETYDLVIVDAPPTLLAPDPAVIGQYAGMSLLVVRHLETTKAEIQSAQKGLATSGVKLSGVILNQYDESKSRYGRYGRKYGYYYGGYRQGYDNPGT